MTSTTPSSQKRVDSGNLLTALAQRVLAYAVLVRLTSTLTGALLAWKIAQYLSADYCLASALVVASSLGGTFVLNDVIDRKSDELNTPWRPIPRGLVTVRVAVSIALTLFGLAFSLGLAVGTQFQVVMLMPILMLCVAYSTTWKTVLFVKNAGVAILTGAVAIYPAAGYARDMRAPLILAAVITAFMLQKEIVSDVRDMAGDMASGRVTLITSSPFLAAAIVVASNVFILAVVWAAVPSKLQLPWASGSSVVMLVANAAWAVLTVVFRNRQLARSYLYFANVIALCGIVSL